MASRIMAKNRRMRVSLCYSCSAAGRTGVNEPGLTAQIEQHARVVNMTGPPYHCRRSRCITLHIVPRPTDRANVSSGIAVRGIPTRNPARPQT